MAIEIGHSDRRFGSHLGTELFKVDVLRIVFKLRN